MTTTEPSAFTPLDAEPPRGPVAVWPQTLVGIGVLLTGLALGFGAIGIVSQRGVVFFRKQDNLTNDIQKQLIQRLGELSGKPETSKLHIHPILNSERELGGSDPEISTISSVQHDKLYKKTPYDQSKKLQGSAQWHSDIAFEVVPADYTSLRLTQLPRTGGGV